MHSISSVQSLSLVWLCNSTGCSTPGFPVHHQVLELAQTHVHWVDDAVPPSHPLSSPSPPALNLSQHQGFSNESVGLYKSIMIYSQHCNLIQNIFIALKSSVLCLIMYVVQLLSRVQLFPDPWTATHQASLSFTFSWSLLKFMFIESVMLSNHLILCHSPSPFALNLFQHQGLFQWVGSSHQVAKVLEHPLQHQSFQWIFRVDFL